MPRIRMLPSLTVFIHERMCPALYFMGALFRAIVLGCPMRGAGVVFLHTVVAVTGVVTASIAVEFEPVVGCFPLSLLLVFAEQAGRIVVPYITLLPINTGRLIRWVHRRCSMSLRPIPN